MRCIVDGCLTVGPTKGIVYHYMPGDAQRRETWLQAINKLNSPVPKHATICSLHFARDCYKEIGGDLKLAISAVPTLNLGLSKQKSNTNEAESLAKPRKMLKRLMPAKNVASFRRINTNIQLCCVPNCVSNHRSSGAAKLFDVPDDPDRRANWISALGLDETILPTGSRICHRHFDGRFIVKGGSYIGQDGIERHYKLRKWRLKEDAMPSKYTDVAVTTEVAVPDERCFKVETTCRTCSIQISDENEGTPLFTGSLSLKKFRPDIFRELVQFDLQIDEDDGLPQKICQKCLQSFSILIQFRKQCQRVQTDLLRYFKGRKNMRESVTNEEDIIMLDDNGEAQETLDTRIAADSVTQAPVESAVLAPGASFCNVRKFPVEDTAPKKVRIECIDENVMIEEHLIENVRPPIGDEGDVENWICEYYIVSDDKKIGNTPVGSEKTDGSNMLGKPGEQISMQSMTGTLAGLPSNENPKEHIPTICGQELGPGRIVQKNCTICQRSSNYCCALCDDCPRLCLDPCFATYHQLIGQMEAST